MTDRKQAPSRKTSPGRPPALRAAGQHGQCAAPGSRASEGPRPPGAGPLAFSGSSPASAITCPPPDEPPPPSRSVSPVLLVCAAHRLVTELTANFRVCHPTSPVIISKAFPVHRTTRQRPSLRSPGLAAGGPLSGPLARPGRQPLRLGPQRGAPPHPSADGTGPASTACPPAPRLLGFTSSSPSTPRGALQAEPRPGSAEPCGFSTHA